MSKAGSISNLFIVVPLETSSQPTTTGFVLENLEMVS